MSVILTDVDGVLLDWSNGFKRFLFEVTGVHANEDISKYDIAERYPDFCPTTIDWLRKSYNRTFHSCNLSPLRDAVTYIRKLREDGHSIHVITTFNPSKNDMTYYKHRIDNLERIFGKGIFDRYIDVEDKVTYINENYVGYADYFIEDMDKNVDGIDKSITTFMMDHPYNRNSNADIMVTTWKSIYNVINHL